jgi:hypothetical protein
LPDLLVKSSIEAEQLNMTGAREIWLSFGQQASGKILVKQKFHAATLVIRRSRSAAKVKQALMSATSSSG